MGDTSSSQAAQIAASGAQYSPAFLQALGFTLPQECVFANGHYGDLSAVVTEHVQNDPGGATKFGIDAASHPGIDIDKLDLAGAEAVYHSHEWAWLNGDRVAAVGDNRLAVALFDCCVNPGPIAILWLQDYLLIHADGIIGEAQTLPAIREAMIHGRINELLNALLGKRAAYYTSRGAWANPFRRGWLNRNVDLSQYLFGAQTVQGVGKPAAVAVGAAAAATPDKAAEQTPA